MTPLSAASRRSLSTAHCYRTYTSLSNGSPSSSRLRDALRAGIYAAGALATVAYVYDSRSAVHEHVAMPVLRTLTDAETSHKLAVKLLGMTSWVRPKDRGSDAESIQTEVSVSAALSIPTYEA